MENINKSLCRGIYFINILLIPVNYIHVAISRIKCNPKGIGDKRYILLITLFVRLSITVT